jgi:hypothetical protein
MKKVYKQAVIGAIALITSTGVWAETVVKSYALTPTTDAGWVITNVSDSEGNLISTVINDKGGSPTDITYTTISLPQGLWTSTNGLPTTGGPYHVLQLKGAKGASLANSPYIIVKFTKTTSTKGIRLIDVFARGNCHLLYAWIKNNANPTIANFDNDGDYDDGPGNEWAVASAAAKFTITVPVDATGIVLVVSNGGQSGDATGSTPFPSGAPDGGYTLTINTGSYAQIDAIGFQSVYDAAYHAGTGAESIQAEKTAVSSSYYDLSGKAVPASAKGFVIKKTVFSDGSISNEKGYNR